jgi:hypothetical protein
VQITLVPPLSIIHRLNLNGRFITFEEGLAETQKAATNHSSEKEESFILEK